MGKFVCIYCLFSYIIMNLLNSSFTKKFRCQYIAQKGVLIWFDYFNKIIFWIQILLVLFLFQRRDLPNNHSVRIRSVKKRLYLYILFHKKEELLNTCLILHNGKDNCLVVDLFLYETEKNWRGIIILWWPKKRNFFFSISLERTPEKIFPFLFNINKSMRISKKIIMHKKNSLVFNARQYNTMQRVAELVLIEGLITIFFNWLINLIFPSHD